MGKEDFYIIYETDEAESESAAETTFVERKPASTTKAASAAKTHSKDEPAHVIEGRARRQRALEAREQRRAAKLAAREKKTAEAAAARDAREAEYARRAQEFEREKAAYAKQKEERKAARRNKSARSE